MIEINGLRKKFGRIQAVDSVSFSVKPGEVLGFLGPNGAGKSTTMRMITGFLTPDAGRIEIDGKDMAENGVFCRGRIGYLPENAPVYPEMTVRAFLDFMAAVRGLTGDAKKKEVQRVTGICELEDVLRQPIDTLSKGYRHRTCLAQALLNDPPLLILDEPTDGLDPNQKHDVRSLIGKMGRDKAIILSTHILEEVDAVCTRVIIVNHGKIIYNGDPDDLRRQTPDAGFMRVKIKHEDRAALRAELEKFDLIQAIESVNSNDGVVEFKLRMKKANDDQTAAQLVKTMIAADLQVLEVAPVRGRLDEVFRTMTTAEGRAVA